MLASVLPFKDIKSRQQLRQGILSVFNLHNVLNSIVKVVFPNVRVVRILGFIVVVSFLLKSILLQYCFVYLIILIGRYIVYIKLIILNNFLNNIIQKTIYKESILFQVFKLLILYKGYRNIVKYINKHLYSNITLLSLLNYYKKEVLTNFKILLILVIIEFLKYIIELLFIILLSILSR